MKVQRRTKTSKDDNSAALELFKDFQVKPFKEIPTTLMVGIVTLLEGTNINTALMFEKLPIYEIPNWKRPHLKKITIPHPGIPYAILSVKYGNEIKGIVKNLGDLNKTGSKGKFPNQISIDVSLSDKVVNIFVFKDRLKISGADKPEHLIEAFLFLKGILLSYKRQGVVMFDGDVPMVIKVEIEMQNVAFNLGFKVKKNVLMQKALEEGLSCPQEPDAVKIQFPMGKKKKKNDEERMFTFRIHHTGAVGFSGNERDQMEPIYDTFMDFIKRHENEIRLA